MLKRANVVQSAFADFWRTAVLIASGEVRQARIGSYSKHCQYLVLSSPAEDRG
jgi:hypothetical protein